MCTGPLNHSGFGWGWARSIDASTVFISPPREPHPEPALPRAGMVSFSHTEGKRSSRTRTAQGFRTASRRATAAVQALSVGIGPLRDSRDFRLLWPAVLPAGLAMGAVGLAVFVQAFELGGGRAGRVLGSL